MTAFPRMQRHLILGWVTAFLLLIALAAFGAHEHSLLSAHKSTDKAIFKEYFVSTVFRHPIEGLFDPTPIKAKCDEIVFQDGLIWQCMKVIGGIGNVGSMIMHCVRMALEAGATTIVLPRIGLRHEDLINLGDKGPSAETAYMIDVGYLIASLKKTCPQVLVLADASRIKTHAPVVQLSPQRFAGPYQKGRLVLSQTGWRKGLDQWMSTNPLTSNITTAQPVRILSKHRTLFAMWEGQTQEFNRSFPRLFKHPPQVRRLAASALWSLQEKMGRPVISDKVLTTSEPHPTYSMVSNLGPGRLVRDGFVGVHLRVEADAARAHYQNYESQVPLFLRDIAALGLTTVYLASGDADGRERFRKDAAREGITVFVGEDLLDGDDLAEMQGLTWDQQAMVDHEVLVHCAHFFGSVRSTFSWSVALRRGLLPDAGPIQWGGEEYHYADDLSSIVGISEREAEKMKGLWT